MKKNYMKPAMQVVEINVEHALLITSGPQTLQGNALRDLGGGAAINARVKRDCYNVWDDNWTE